MNLKNKIQYSVVIPLKNEESNITDLLKELEPVMQALQKPWEVLCINDGSTDNTKQILEQLAKNKPQLRVLNFTRNFGQSSAFDAGFRHAYGEFVITLDGDGQNNPADIPKLIQVSEHADLVCGWRKTRKDTFVKKCTSRIANFVRSRICQDQMHDTGCSLKVYRKSALDKIKMFHGMHRFLPALFQIEGLRVIEVPVSHRERLKGKSNYHFFNRSLNTIIDMLAVLWMRKRRLKYQFDQRDHP